MNLRVSFGGLSPLFEPVLFPLIKEISFCAAQINDFWTAISIFLLNRTLLAVICVGDSGAAVDDASALVRTIIALVADAHQGARPHIRVTNDTFSVALLAQASNGDSRLLPAKNQVWMMFRHFLTPSPLVRDPLSPSL